MTKYILTGGQDRAARNAGYGQRLALELHKQYGDFRLLSCFFVAAEEHWAVLAEHWDEWFRKEVGGINRYDYARKDAFASQLRDYDIIYLHGGDNKMLKDAMGAFEPLEELFKGKTIIGSSAGANLLSTNFWSSRLRKPFKGRAVLDINVMTHYGADRRDVGNQLTQQDWEDDERKFQKFLGVNEKIWRIPEGQIVTFEVSD